MGPVFFGATRLASSCTAAVGLCVAAITFVAASRRAAVASRSAAAAAAAVATIATGCRLQTKQRLPRQALEANYTVQVRSKKVTDALQKRPSE